MSIIGCDATTADDLCQEAFALADDVVGAVMRGFMPKVVDVVMYNNLTRVMICPTGYKCGAGESVFSTLDLTKHVENNNVSAAVYKAEAEIYKACIHELMASAARH